MPIFSNLNVRFEKTRANFLASDPFVCVVISFRKGLFLRGGGGAIIPPPPPKNNFCTAKTAETNLTRGAMQKKIRQVLFTIIISIFDVNKILAQAYCPPKEIVHNLKVGTHNSCF